MGKTIMSEEIKDVMKAGVSILMDVALELLQRDPHQWSTRPCSTCRAISSIIGKPFGCYLYQKEKVAGKTRGENYYG